MRVKNADAMSIAAFLSVPLLGSPLMLAICVEFLCTGLARSNSRVSDTIALIGFFIAHVLAVLLLYVSFSAERCLLWCLTTWPLHYAFCQFALRPKE
jgi:hypothetical protein